MKDVLAESIKTEILRIRKDIRAIVIFGSYARGESFKDIDILIVADNLPGLFVERDKEISSIKMNVSVRCGLDIILHTSDECMENFRGHNPLFLSIVNDGIILYDAQFITPVIHEIKNYIKESGIKETLTGGWRFPVKWRRAASLSPLSTKDWAYIWLEDGRDDLKAAEVLYEDGFYAKAVTHAQQGSEKAAKAILACFGVFEKTHYLSSVVRDEIKDKEFDGREGDLIRLVNLLSFLEPHATLSRYPEEREGKIWIPLHEYSKEKVKELLGKGGEVLKIGEDFIKWYFKEK